jgi:hypothetical protein
VHLAGCTANPSSAWVSQQARQLAWGLAERSTSDLDGIFPRSSAIVAEPVVHRWSHGLPYVRPGREKVQDAETAIRTGHAAAAAARAHLSR